MNKYYILYNGKIWLSDKMITFINHDYTSELGISIDEFVSNNNEWLSSLEPCDIDKYELEKVKNKVYTLDNCKFGYAIDITDLLFDYGCDHDGVWRPNLKFRPKKSESLESNEKCDCGYIADENGICTECNLPKPFGNTEQVECCKRNEKGVKMCTLKCCRKSENTEQDYDSRPYSEKEQIILWIAKRIRDEQRKHSYHDENWHEIAARKIYASYNINLKND